MARKSLAAKAAAVTFLGLTSLAPSQADAAVVGLSLLIDQSGSISAANYALQKSGYINALTALLPVDGSVALEVKQFGTTVQSVFALQTITAATKVTLLANLTAMTQSGGGTATGPAIQSAAADLLGFAGLTRRVIDVSTDGFGNVGINEGVAALAAVAAGINQVNVLCIGGSANCNFNAGTGSFNVNASFENFENTLKGKLVREITPGVPEPSTWAMMIIGFAGLAFASFRKRAVAAA
jgi:hypothetical protein